MSLSDLRRRLLEEEEGFTLPELLVSMTMMVTVLFALYAIFDASVRIFHAGGNELKAVESARLGFEKMEREIRAAYPRDDGALLDAGSNGKWISFRNRPDSGAPKNITYSMSGGSKKFLKRGSQKIAGPLDGASSLRFAYCENATSCSSSIVPEDQVELVRVTLTVGTLGAANASQTLTTDVLLRNR